MARIRVKSRGTSGGGSDTTPDAFTFTDVSGQIESTPITGAPVTISGINASTAFTVSGGTVQINGTGSFVASGSVVNGDTLTPKGTSNATYLGFTNVTVTVGGVADTFSIQTRSDPAAGFATIGPHASYNGTADSGAGVPSGAYAWRQDVPGGFSSTPMTIGRIMTCPGQRLAGTFLLKIPCDAKGGITRIDLSGDNAATSINAIGMAVFTDVNGVGHPEFYHAVFIDAAAFVAKGGTDGSRRANIYATIIPTNGALNKRLLSFHFFPASTATDGTYNVGSGQTYSTIRAALDAARTAGKKAPLIQIKTTANYEMEDSTWGIYTSGQGFAVITTDAGVVATIRRASAFNPTNQASWQWTPGWDGIEFRGAGIVFDQRNVTKIVMSTKPCFMNGCKVTNSIGTRDTLYWNGSPHPGFGVTTASWWQYHDFEFGCNTFVGQLACIGGQARGLHGDMYTDTPLVYSQHDEDSNSNYMRQGNGAIQNTGLMALTIRYSGTGAGTVTRLGGNGYGWLVFSDGNHPGADLTIDLGAIDNFVQVSDVAAALNARSGWAATVQDNTRSARYIRGYGFGDVNVFPATDAKTADLILATFIDDHGDGTQTYGGKENYIYWNWLLDTSINLSSVIFSDGQANPGGTLGDRDMSFVNCIFTVDGSNPTTLGGDGAFHKLYHHLTMNVWVSPGSGYQEVYTEMANCLTGAINGNSIPPVHFFNNIHTIPSGGSEPSGATFTGNVSLGTWPTADILNVLTDIPGHNFKPTGTALTTLYPNLFPYDRNGVLRSANDCVGAISKNAA